MKRPNLVNPNNLWSPFHSIPIPESIPPPMQPVQPSIQRPSYTEIEFPRPISRKELLQRNSFYLNLFGLVIILGIAYFLYNVYLERRVFTEYLYYIKNVQEEHYPGFL